MNEKVLHMHHPSPNLQYRNFVPPILTLTLPSLPSLLGYVLYDTSSTIIAAAAAVATE